MLLKKIWRESQKNSYLKKRIPKLSQKGENKLSQKGNLAGIIFSGKFQKL